MMKVDAVVAGERCEVDALECWVDGLVPGSTSLPQSVEPFVQEADQVFLAGDFEALRLAHVDGLFEYAV